MPASPFAPTTLEEMGQRLLNLERQNATLWSLIGEAYAMRDQKNYADYIVNNVREAGGMFSAEAGARLDELIARGPASRGN